MDNTKSTVWLGMLASLLLLGFSASASAQTESSSAESFTQCNIETGTTQLELCGDRAASSNAEAVTDIAAPSKTGGGSSILWFLLSFALAYHRIMLR